MTSRRRARANDRPTIARRGLDDPADRRLPRRPAGEEDFISSGYEAFAYARTRAVADRSARPSASSISSP